MKEFRKTENGLFVCEECNKTFHSIRKLSRHISVFHENTQKYHNKWIKEENDNKCKIKLKQIATIDNGFDYIMIVDKDYTLFNYI